MKVSPIWLAQAEPFLGHEDDSQSKDLRAAVRSWVAMVELNLVPIQPIALAAVRWASDGKHYVTVIIKATFAFGSDGSVELADPGDPISSADEHYEKSPLKSLRDASDLVPYLGAGEVLFTGSAYLASEHVLSRIAVFQANAPLLDKRFYVKAPKQRANPVEKVAIVAENAAQDMARNPVGRTDPLLVDTRQATAPVLVGPIARMWRERSDLLRKEDKKALAREEMLIEPGFAWDYFHSAPKDQRIRGFLRGSEVVVLENLQPLASNAATSQVTVALPSGVAEARWLRTGGQPTAIALNADTLRIDADQRRISLTWRGFFDASEGGLVTVVAGLALPQKPIAWPDFNAVHGSAAGKSFAVESELDTTHAGDSQPLGSTMPFSKGANSRPSALVSAPSEPHSHAADRAPDSRGTVVGPPPKRGAATPFEGGGAESSPDPFRSTIPAESRRSHLPAMPFEGAVPASAAAPPPSSKRQDSPPVTHRSSASSDGVDLGGTMNTAPRRSPVTPFEGLPTPSAAPNSVVPTAAPVPTPAMPPLSMASQEFVSPIARAAPPAPIQPQAAPVPATIQLTPGRGSQLLLRVAEILRQG